MSTTSVIRLPLRAIAASTVLVLAACNDDPTSVDDRVPPVRVNVESVSTTLATATEFATPSSPLLVAVGVAVPYDIVFLDEDGIVYEPSADQFLEVVFEDAGIARFETDADGDFTGDFRGVSQGMTGVRFRLMRGTPGSAAATVVFNPFPIPVNVVP